MKKRLNIKCLFFALLIVLFTACEDTTDSLGSSIVSGPDYIKANSLTFYPWSSSVKADTIYTRSSTAYLGKYTHPDFGSFESSFMTQFNVAEAYQIPDFSSVVPDNGKEGLDEDVNDRSITPVRFYLGGLYSGYFGDSTAVGRINVYQLSHDLYNSDDIYYSNINPDDFYSASDLIGSAFYSPVDLSVSEEDREDNYQYVIIDLPISKGKEIIQLYQKCKKEGLSFRNEFLKKFKGIYAKQVQGDGALLYLDQVRLYFDMLKYEMGADGKPLQTVEQTDSTSKFTFSFSTTKEIVQVNNFRNNTPESLLEEDTCTYLKSPSGLFTKVSLPLREIANTIVAKGDSLNGIAIAFAIDSLTDKISGLSAPGNILMIRDTATVNGMFYNYQKDFFSDNRLPDNITSFVTSLSSGKYTFSDIRKLISTVIEEYGGVEKVPEYLNVLLIPVDLTYDSSTVIGVNHYFKPALARLLGGKDSDRKRIQLKVYYTIFQ